MRKSKNITKYEVEWQFLRVSLKGHFNENIEYKLDQVRSYFEKTMTYDRWERVYNWIEGLQRGFKAHSNLAYIQRLAEELDYYKLIKPDISTSSQSLKTLNNYPLKDRVVLWKDLFKTNKAWLQSGYYHQECNHFLNEIFQSINQSQFNNNLDQDYSDLLQLRQQASTKLNSHKFFF